MTVEAAAIATVVVREAGAVRVGDVVVALEHCLEGWSCEEIRGIV